MSLFLLSAHKNGDNTDLSNCREITFLSTSYKIMSRIFLSRLSAYMYEIIGGH
jgi:hypothetical protein